MNSHFLELLGHFLIQAAKNQQFLEQFIPGASKAQDKDWDFSKWVQYCYQNLSYFQSFFPKSAGMDQMSENSKQTQQLWQEGLNNFYKQWEEFAQIMGLVPQQEYNRLAQENEQLKERIHEQEQTIKRLHSLLEQKGIFDLNQLSDEFGRLLHEQNEQFKKFMQAFDQTCKARSGSDSSESK